MYLAMNAYDWWNYEHFTMQEMQCKCGCGLLPQKSYMDVLQSIRYEAGFPFMILSGARCPVHNRNIGSTSVGHPLGVAADIRVYGERAFRLIRIALNYTEITGIGFRQNLSLARERRMIHLDSLTPEQAGGARPNVWSY